MNTTASHIKNAIRELGIQNQPMIVHSSLKSFGWVEGGPTTVIDALLDEGCTVIVPSFDFESFVAPPPGVRPERNAISYDPYPAPQAGVSIPVYTHESNSIARGLGAIPCALIEYEDRVRGSHPLESFTAVGPLSHQLIDTQTPTEVFAPFDELADLRGWVVLMGVGLNRATLIHHAEQKAGRHPFIRWANGADGKPFEAWLSGCSGGFDRLEEPLAHLKREITVGESLWKVYPVKEMLEQAAMLIKNDPQITHCSNPDCLSCNDAIAGGPIA
ncbi:MAG: AAC(3) family N-acetyltransferase [Armatimonadota bacterium]